MSAGLVSRRVSALYGGVMSALLLTLTGCSASAPQSASAPAAPAPTPTPTTASVDVLPCIEQVLPADLNRAPPGTRISDLIIPDTLTIWPELTQAFPNGRQLSDPVIDITLGVVLLDLTARGQNAASFAAMPLNPAASERPPRSEFPFAALPHGPPPLDPGTGTNFVFDMSPVSAYVQVDRAGMPAVATALILGPRKNAYNDANAQADTANTFTFDLIEGLRVFSQPLQDDIRARGLIPCAVPRAG